MPEPFFQFFIELRHRIKPIRRPRSHGSPNYLCSSLNIQIARAHVTAAQRLGVAEVIQLCLHYTMDDKGIRPLVPRVMHREGSTQVNHLSIYPLGHAMLHKIVHGFQAVHFVLDNVSKPEVILNPMKKQQGYIENKEESCVRDSAVRLFRDRSPSQNSWRFPLRN